MSFNLADTFKRIKDWGKPSEPDPIKTDDYIIDTTGIVQTIDKERALDYFEAGRFAGLSGQPGKTVPKSQDYAFSPWLEGFNEGVRQRLRGLPVKPSDSCKIEPWELIEDWCLGFNVGNAVVAVSRCSGAITVEDLKAAYGYLKKEREWMVRGRVLYPGINNNIHPKDVIADWKLNANLSECMLHLYSLTFLNNGMPNFKMFADEHLLNAQNSISLELSVRLKE